MQNIVPSEETLLKNFSIEDFFYRKVFLLNEKLYLCEIITSQFFITMCISNRIGPPVEGEDFYGREKEIRKAIKLLDSNHSLLLSAPRRIGKSSLAKRLIEVKKKDGWKCVYIDLEETTTEEGFLRLIIESFKKNDICLKV